MWVICAIQRLRFCGKNGKGALLFGLRCLGFLPVPTLASRGLAYPFRRTARLFFGRTRVMAAALGASEDKECRAGISTLAQVGLFGINSTFVLLFDDRFPI